MSYKSGFISIIGRPNAGKSTLLNAILQEKVAITTPKPQTTRNNISGILRMRSLSLWTHRGFISRSMSWGVP